MTQHDMDIANADGASVRADLNNALAALVSTNSGATEPADIFANMLWYDTTNNQLKMRNEADSAWITVGNLDQVNNTFSASIKKQFGSSDYQSVTISVGEVTVSATDGRRSLNIEAETGTADDLTKVNTANFADGDMIIITPDSGDTITVVDTAGGAGQIHTADGVNVGMSSQYTDTMVLMRVGADWYEVSRSTTLHSGRYLDEASNLSDLTNTTTARTNLGLGSAATVNTGVSGATIPLLNGNNTYDGTSTFSSTVTVNAATNLNGVVTIDSEQSDPGLQVKSDNGGSEQGPFLELYRNSSSPANSDALGRLGFTGNTANGTRRWFSWITGELLDTSNTAWDGEMYFWTATDGLDNFEGWVSTGWAFGAPSGNTKGTGTINVQNGIFDNNVQVQDYVFEYAQENKIDVEEYDTFAPDGKDHTYAREFLDGRTQYLDLDEFSNFWKTNYHFPNFPGKHAGYNYDKESQDLGSMICQLIEVCELQSVHIEQLNQRLKKLTNLVGDVRCELHEIKDQ